MRDVANPNRVVKKERIGNAWDGLAIREERRSFPSGLFLETREEVLGLASAVQQRKGVGWSYVQMEETLATTLA